MPTTYKLTPRDRAERGAARLLARLSDKTARRLAGKPIVLDGQTLDPHVQIILKAMERTGPGAWARLGPEAARREVQRTAIVNSLPIPKVADVKDLTVPGPACELPARMYRAPGHLDPGPQP